MIPFTRVRPFSHKIRNAWRYYRCVVEFFGPTSHYARRVRSGIRRQIGES